MSEALPTRANLTLFLSGDVMLGRGIDQILPNAGDSRLFEPCVRSAVDFRLGACVAVERNGELAVRWAGRC